MNTALTPRVCNSTLRIQHDKDTGTGFFFYYEGIILFATCFHLGGNRLTHANPLKFWKDGKFQPFDMEWFSVMPEHDTVIIKPASKMIGRLRNEPLPGVNSSMIIGEWAKFPGFPRMPKIPLVTNVEQVEWPTRTDDVLSGLAIPVVKKASLAFIYPNSSLILLDGHNSMGFSGSPIMTEADNIHAITRGFVIDKKGQNIGLIMAHRLSAILDTLKNSVRF